MAVNRGKGFEVGDPSKSIHFLVQDAFWDCSLILVYLLLSLIGHWGMIKNSIHFSKNFAISFTPCCMRFFAKSCSAIPHRDSCRWYLIACENEGLLFSSVSDFTVTGFLLMEQFHRFHGYKIWKSHGLQCLILVERCPWFSSSFICPDSHSLFVCFWGDVASMVLAALLLLLTVLGKEPLTVKFR